ncbi:thiamine pyrophosphate-dependent dehydrogenase E1 component subunit alpha [Candidatus Woesearchaeota archaeon]|nr:thiamine pyrophosphate-dependent dehydrogenase E1 component subunit alpha [Candidatus Woesearchaeota archaeon]
MKTNLKISKEQSLAFYKDMLRIRKFEEAISDVSEDKEIKTPCHLYIGQEAIAVGACRAVEKEDYAFAFYRGHGHYIAKGGDTKKMVAEIFCKSTGCCKGRGGSMHLISPEVNLFGSTAIVAGQIAPAAGVALSSKLRDDKKVTLLFFGEGATEEGVFSEIVNFASLKKLPLIMICENNNAAAHMKLSERQPIDDMYLKTEPYMPSFQIDGNDVIEVYSKVKEAAERARDGQGPTFIECMTFRWKGHVGPLLDIDKGLRTAQEIDSWKAKDPLLNKDILSGLLDSEIRDIELEVDDEVKQAFRFARESSKPDPATLLDDIYAD